MSETRPPVIAVMGHIDHGKSTLLDYIRKTNITEKEAGGITQHVSAYEVRHLAEDGRETKMTFLDTPGHEAFQGIRSRGANIADIAVLVVSAEDGVKPQTLEALESIKAGSLPYIVAITKIDRPGANIDMAKQSLAENQIYVEGYGGDVPVVALSAKTGDGVPELLDTLVLLADLENFIAEKEAPGEGVILESKLDPRKGITAVGVIKNGTVSRGMIAASAGAVAPIRFLLDEAGNTVEELSFSSPAQIVGWDNMPRIGAPWRVFLKKDEAVEYAASEAAEKGAGAQTAQADQEGVEYLPLFIKADTAGSLEAIVNEIKKLARERIAPKVILSSIGGVTETDVKSALATEGSVILAFNTKVDGQASSFAERSGIPILSFNIIYELTDKVKEFLVEREPRIEVEETIGTAKVLKVFSATKDKQVLGGRVLSGVFNKNASVKVIRREETIGKGKVKELQQAKLAIDSVNEGNEFGAMVESKLEIAPGDILEAVTMVTK